MSAQREQQAQLLELRASLIRMNFTQRFEIEAERFYAATGFLAPGKSVPLEMCRDGYYNERRAAWDKWIADQALEFAAACAAGAAALRQSSAVLNAGHEIRVGGCLPNTVNQAGRSPQSGGEVAKHPTSPNVAMESSAAVQELKAVFKLVKEASEWRDNGYEKCCLCDGWAHMNEPFIHGSLCVLKVIDARIAALKSAPPEVPHAD